MKISPKVIVLTASILTLTACGQLEPESTPSALPTVVETKEPTLTEKTLQNLILRYQAKDMMADTDYKYTFQLNDALVGKKIVTRARLYDITQKDVNTYYLHFQQNRSTLLSMRLQSLNDYYELEYPADKITALLELLDSNKDAFGIVAEITSAHPMKLDIIGDIEDKDTGAVTIGGDPARYRVIRGTCLELIPVLSDDDEWQARFDEFFK